MERGGRVEREGREDGEGREGGRDAYPVDVALPKV